MKKSARQLLRTWGQTIAALKPGETIEVTNRGKPVVQLTKPAPRPRRALPDFAQAARHDNIQVGNRLLQRLLAEDEAIS